MNLKVLLQLSPFFLAVFLFSKIVAQNKKEPGYILVSNVNYIPKDTLKANIFLPLNYKNQKNPVLLFIDGFGGDFRNSGHYTGWARFAASQGFISIVYSSRKNYVRESFEKAVSFIFTTSATYFTDEKRISIYAGSGNVKQGLPLANADNRIKAALIYYGSAKMTNFRLDLPVLLVRAGLDNVQLNKELDSLALQALVANAPYTITNFNSALHAFEDFTDDEISLPFMMSSLNFLKQNMREQTSRDISTHEREIIGMREVYQSNWKAALGAFTQALKNNPGNNEAERQAGNICLEIKEYRKALAYYDSAVEHGNWRTGEIAIKKLYAYAKLNDVDGAVTQMRVLKKAGWFNAGDYLGNPDYTNVINSEKYKKFRDE